MEYATLGHSEIEVSRICVGGMSFGAPDPNHHVWTLGPEETMEALDGLVRAGKVRALGASEMYAYQLHNLQDIALRHGWTPFTNMQCHHNLLYRENEREMIPVCRQFDMAITPYSPLASGHLTRPTWDSDSLRSKTDAVMASKYDSEETLDLPIIERVAQLAGRRGVLMSQIAIAWHLGRGIESPTLGFSKPERVDDAVAAVDLKLTDEELDFLEEPYVALELVSPAARPGEKALAGSAPLKAKTA